MLYDIELSYQTGDSFNTYHESSMLEFPTSLETAKINLKRIKAHYEIYQKRHRGYSSRREEIKFPDFYISTMDYKIDRTGRTSKSDCDGIKLLKDDGTEHEMLSGFWLGYFEYLESGRIVAYSEVESDLEFRI